MADPRTVNAGIVVPLTGADVDTWADVAVNPNMVAIDGFFCGVQSIAVTNAPVTLTSPAAFVPTPTPGPTQSQNRVLRFTGVLTAAVLITLPLPGAYICENRTTGNFNLQFRAVAAGEVVAIPPGATTTIYNDGTNVRFSDLGKIGQLEFWAGISNVPAWTTGCTIPPYVLCDGGILNFAPFPYLGALLGSSFGGNGITTFGIPDLRGRYPLSVDSTGVRVTVAGCGINGSVLGQAQDAQTVTLNSSQMPVHFHDAGIFDSGHTHSSNAAINSGGSGTGGGAFSLNSPGGATINTATTGVRVISANGIDTTYSAGGGLPHNNMPNTLVAGIWVIKTG